MANKNAASKNDANMENVSEALSRSEQFIEKNQKLLLILLVAIVVVAGAIVLFKNNYLAPKNLEAAEMMFKGEQYFAADSFALALNGDDDEYIGFESIISQYGITKSAKLAKGYAGLCYKGLGDYENAIKYLSAAPKKDIMVGPAFEGAIGDCYVALGDNDKAASCFMKAAGMKNDVLAPMYLMKAARVYEADGKYGKALAAYQTIKKSYPLSQEGTEVDKYIARAEALK